MMMMMMMMMIIVTTIAFKGEIGDFLQSPHCAAVSNTYGLVARVQSCANHVQDIEGLSRAICRVTCHLVRRGSSATKFGRVSVAFILSISYWLNHQTHY